MLTLEAIVDGVKLEKKCETYDRNIRRYTETQIRREARPLRLNLQHCTSICSVDILNTQGTICCTHTERITHMTIKTETIK